ncbi:phosphatidate cytidylyltransferase, mitochondrial isoform X3 [Rhinolophus sinicus]|uniref:phosphatidate cytidylyltransferase, mitochondrial isoform X3 n=1 Tax=Rhinolophus sinicus TaxID=89399 RepID=UPI003D7AE0DC
MTVSLVLAGPHSSHPRPRPFPGGAGPRLFHLPTFNRSPWYSCPAPLASALPRVPFSEPRPHGAAELGGGLPQDPVSLPRGVEPGFRLRLRGVPPGGAEFRSEVDDPVAWHSKNLKKNWNHYSFLKVLGSKFITTVQNNYGAGVYYNPLILCDGRLIKYGVISTRVLIEDLLNWSNLYIAGRLQKPVKIVAMNENVALRSALDKNLKSAVTAAFLMLPESFSEEDLFIEIAGLSYSDKSPEGQFTQLMTLPKTLQQQINHIMDPPGKNRDVEETLLQLAHDPDCADVVRLGLSAIVRPSSIRQSTKGIFTAGMKKSLIYSSLKLHKMWKGWLRKTS